MKVPARTQGSHDIAAELAPVSRLFLSAQQIIHNEVVAGVSLLIAAAIALLWANSPWAEHYHAMVSMPIGFHIGSFSFGLDLRHWVNDGLMVVFFFAVGLEIKREFVHGELSDWQTAVLPLAAAGGGMVLPALLYLWVNQGLETADGWGIPIPTDIAFALGALALLGNRVPMQLRTILLALAAVDDIGAVLVIAIVYAHSISWTAITSAMAILCLVLVMRWIGLRTVPVFVVVGIAFWLAIQHSGMHATIAGVILGVITPASAWFSHLTFAQRIEELSHRFRRMTRWTSRESAQLVLGQIETLTKETEPVLDRLQRMVHPWVTYGVLPLFALVNAGITFSIEHVFASVSSPVAQGVVLGLFLGKPLGILTTSWLVVRLKLARLPDSLNWTHVGGIGVLAGIGFTVSLFLSGLAFTNAADGELAKLGIISASVLAGSMGLLLLSLTSRHDTHHKDAAGAHER